MQCLVRCAIAIYVTLGTIGHVCVYACMHAVCVRRHLCVTLGTTGHVCMYAGTIGDVSDAVGRFMLADILPNLPERALQNSNAFRKRFCYIESTSRVLERHAASLTSLYLTYADASQIHMSRIERAAAAAKPGYLNDEVRLHMHPHMHTQMHTHMQLAYLHVCIHICTHAAKPGYLNNDEQTGGRLTQQSQCMLSTRQHALAHLHPSSHSHSHSACSPLCTHPVTVTVTVHALLPARIQSQSQSQCMLSVLSARIKCMLMWTRVRARCVRGAGANERGRMAHLL